MRVLALLLALCLLLTGCSWRSGSYVSVQPHTGSYSPSSRETPSSTAGTFLELRTAICDLIDDGQESGLILLPDYAPENLESDILSAVDYACNTYPLGAYALEDLTWNLGTSGGQRALRLTFSYRFSRSTVSQIQLVRRSADARALIQNAMASCESLLVFQVANYTGSDFEQMVQDYARSNCDIVMETPQVIVSLYPETGARRLVEIQFTYQNNRDDLQAMQSDVSRIFRSAALYLLPDEEPLTGFQQLYTFLMERSEYTYATSTTPAYSLLVHGVGDSRAFATVYATMCQKAGLSCQVVNGTRGGESWYWNLIYDGQQYYHLDLLSGRFQPLEDWKMTDYVWNYTAYPASVQSAPPPATEPAATEPAPTQGADAVS